MHVALASDKAYLPWLATAVLSCLRQANEARIVVHVQHTADVTPADQARLRAMVEAEDGVLELHPLDPEELGPLPAAVSKHGGAISCARFLLPELLGHLDRVIYLDADTLTVSPLDPLWTLPLTATVAAVRNVVEPCMHPRLGRLGITDPARYFNSGLLVMNLAKMRAEQTSAALLSYVRAHGEELLWVDQDALNVVLAGDWLELEARWNAQNSFWDWQEWAERTFPVEELAEARRHPAVLHFEGPSLCKPWHYLCQHEYVQTYRDTLAGTPWAGEPPTDRTVLTRLIRRLPPRHRRLAFLRLQRGRQRVIRALGSVPPGS